jgi:hypothetical protein
VFTDPLLRNGLHKPVLLMRARMLQPLLSNGHSLHSQRLATGLYATIYKNLVHTSLETRYFPATKSSCFCFLEKQSLFTVRTIRNTETYSVGRMHSFCMLEQVIHRVPRVLLLQKTCHHSENRILCPRLQRTQKHVFYTRFCFSDSFYSYAIYASDVG